jgi:hypothetical protein
VRVRLGRRPTDRIRRRKTPAPCKGRGHGRNLSRRFDIGKPTCSESGCDRPRASRGLCQTHYEYKRRHGQLPTTWHRPTTEELFWERVDKNGPTPAACPELGPCWIWVGALTTDGRGTFNMTPGKGQAAHRLMYEKRVGPIDGMSVVQRCKVRRCVNPDHLEARPLNDPSFRFWEKVNKDSKVPEWRPDLSPCWMWTGATIKGYGALHLKGTTVEYAHRFAYMELVGAIPKGWHLDHLCRVPLCVNPEHLEAVTPAEHMRRSQRLPKTHCVHGHAYVGDNVRIDKRTGQRRCATCQREQGRENARRYAAAKKQKS